MSYNLLKGKKGLIFGALNETSRHGSSCCPRRWKRRWKGGNYSRCCNVRVDERRLFRQGKVWYTKFIYEDLWRMIE